MSIKNSILVLLLFFIGTNLLAQPPAKYNHLALSINAKKQIDTFLTYADTIENKSDVDRLYYHLRFDTKSIMICMILLCINKGNCIFI